jgi:subtilisin family serine protease
VANAIRYAVDNGARVVNMSFGKSYSPYSTQVRAAFQYAADRNVLIVHAAGNDHQDNDVADNFPNRYVDPANGIEVPGWLEVGASSAFKGEELPADFSNYGKKSVDLFAPGVNIVSTVPGNKYDSYSGTSMASPTVAGVAALVLSQHPELSAHELKELLLKTTVKYPGLEVLLPQEETDNPAKVLFERLSLTGGVVNVYEALTRVLQGRI